ncbi:hypothetical protein L6164_030884 [Bauhinia variegata]|uniref:Uncharacterized protein n=1 Tax=Bauhinia variegata TaxID=167791 RepID=A0ACB9LDS5_BAUVA|nr:hypothetical protein L6164_030884 [Bauhinia variegata]
MASTVQIAVLIGLLALSLSLSANARPCRTIFISYSVSVRRSGDHHFPADQNPSSGTITTFAEIRSIPVYIIRNGDNSNNHKPLFPGALLFDRAFPGHEDHSVEEEVEIERKASQIRPPFGFSSYDFSSLRDRTKDILSVVVALLFGVGCGALTAATMYLVWSMFSNRYDYRASYGDIVDKEEDEIPSPKKMGYLKIPAAESVPAPVKEGV